jgi:hypothetical protein
VVGQIPVVVALGAAKYKQTVPTPGPGLDGAAPSLSPSSRAASGPSTATTTYGKPVCCGMSVHCVL